jgi:hypothetical protein
MPFNIFKKQQRPNSLNGAYRCLEGAQDFGKTRSLSCVKQLCKPCWKVPALEAGAMSNILLRMRAGTLRSSQRTLQGGQRDLDKELTALNSQEKGLMLEIKK